MFSFYSPNIPRCQYIKVNGTQCGSPAMRRNLVPRVSVPYLDANLGSALPHFHFLQRHTKSRFLVATLLGMTRVGNLDGSKIIALL